MSQKKRQVPFLIQKILRADVAATKKFTKWSDNKLNGATFRKYYKALELSCHGIPWFAFWVAFSWLFNDISLIQMQVNMLLGLFLDIIFVALIKAYTRRRRPVINQDDALGQIGPDVFSFPSGHASRAVYVSYFFMNLHPISIFLKPFLLLWSTGVCVSRILMHRHHILDVIAGVLLGLTTGGLLGFFYLEDETAKWMLGFLSDEKLDGGEYHV